MKTKFVLILLFLTANIFAIQKTAILYNSAIISGINQQYSSTGYTYFSTPSSVDFQVGINYASQSTCTRGYVEFNMSSIPTNAIITYASLHLQAYDRLPDYASKSTILIKSIDSFIYNQNTDLKAWNAFNSGTTTFYNEAINYNDYINLSGTALVSYLSQRKGLKVGIAIINGNEQYEGIAFEKDNSNLFLSISYILPTPPTNVQAVYKNSTNNLIASWTPSTDIIGYNIYMKHNTYGTYKVGSTYANNYTFSAVFDTGWSVLVASYNSGGESEKVTATTSLLISNFTVRDFGGDNIILTWNRSDNTKSYDIFEYYPNHHTIATISGSQVAYSIPKSTLTGNYFAFGLCARNPLCSYTPNAVYYNKPPLLKVKGNYNIENDLNENTNLYVSPNPAIDQLLVVGFDKTFDVTITNLKGQTVKSLSNVSQTIDMRDLQSGIYIVKIKSGDKEITQKIIKN